MLIMRKKVHVLDATGFGDEEFALAIAVQGLLAQNGETFLIDVDHYVEYLDKEAWAPTRISLADLIKLHQTDLPGYFVYDYKAYDGQYNAAITLASATGLLPVPNSLRNMFVGEPVRDLSKEKEPDIQRTIWLENREKLGKNGLIHMVISENDHKPFLRDFALRNKWASLYFPETAEGRKFLDEVLSYLDKGITIYGWTSDEISFVEAISRYGDFINPSDWSSNKSFFASDKLEKATRKKLPDIALPNKHYACLMVSDGDNTQWLERDFAFNSFYGQRLSKKRDYPLTMTTSPSLCYICPTIIRSHYEMAKNEDWVSGVSGLGYMNPCAFPKENLPLFVDKTAEAMEKADLQIVTLLDNLANMDEETVKRVVETYAAKKEIEGGLWEIDPICYRGGEGKMFFASNGKPFVSARYSLWKSNDILDDWEASKKFVEDLATKINSEALIDPNSEKGYSLINVHPWSMKNEEVDYFVSLLREDIQLLGATEFLNLVKRNLAKK